MTLERLWAGWRSEYVESAIGEDKVRTDSEDDCVFCRILADGQADRDGLGASQVVWRDHDAAVLVNAFPYTSGHVLVLPTRHVADLAELRAQESMALWTLTTSAVEALKTAYSPDGINLGANLGRGAGAGIPGHLHLHCLPRWTGDTNFMTTVANTRVLPEALSVTCAKVRAAWPR